MRIIMRCEQAEHGKLIQAGSIQQKGGFYYTSTLPHEITNRSCSVCQIIWIEKNPLPIFLVKVHYIVQATIVKVG